MLPQQLLMEDNPPPNVVTWDDVRDWLKERNMGPVMPSVFEHVIVRDHPQFNWVRVLCYASVVTDDFRGDIWIAHCAIEIYWGDGAPEKPTWRQGIQSFCRRACESGYELPAEFVSEVRTRYEDLLVFAIDRSARVGEPPDDSITKPRPLPSPSPRPAPGAPAESDKPKPPADTKKILLWVSALLNIVLAVGMFFPIPGYIMEVVRAILAVIQNGF